MRMPSSSSVILATLASSASFTALVNAAPTDSSDSAAIASAPGTDALPVGAATGLAGGVIPGLGRREVDVEPRQLAGLVDTLAGMVPLVDAVLGALGLQRQGAASTASVLPQDQLDKIQSLVAQATGGLPVSPGSLPISPGSLPGPVGGVAGGVAGTVTGGHNGTAHNGTAGNSTSGSASSNTTADAHEHARRETPQWADDRHSNRNGGAGAQGVALPLQMDVIPGGTPLGAGPSLPVSPPVSPPAGLAPGTPAGAPLPPQLPNPFSPGLPPNPPNTPAAQAMSSPPLFNPAANEGNATYPANGTETSSGAPYYPTESA